MSLSEKEMSLLKDLRSQEKLCVEKYNRYSEAAHDGQLKNLFSQIGSVEHGHLTTLDDIASGSVPSPGGGQKQAPQPEKSGCTPEQQREDAYLCADALATEKLVSSEYDYSIFEFVSPQIRAVLNSIQKEEQQHGKMIYDYMSQNGMYG